MDEQLVERLRKARSVAVLTGAGVSAESGIPTFRDAQTGLWARYDPEELATEAAFRRYPARVFGWYAWRRRLVRAAAPHAGYHALVALERLVPELAIVTQNVDGLHGRAGSRRVLELHGSLDRFSCVDARHPFPADGIVEPEADTECEPPRCERCGSPVRPDVVWFGEMLPEDAMADAFVHDIEQGIQEFAREALGGKALLIDIGVVGTPQVRADWTREQVAEAGGKPLAKLLASPTRQEASPVMVAGATKLLLRAARAEIDGVHHRVQVTRRRQLIRAATEPQHRVHDFRALLHDGFDAVHAGANFVGLVGVVFDDLSRAFDDGEDVVEIMRNAGRQRAERIHLLAVQQFAIGHLQFARALGDLVHGVGVERELPPQPGRVGERTERAADQFQVRAPRDVAPPPQSRGLMPQLGLPLAQPVAAGLPGRLVGRGHGRSLLTGSRSTVR